MEPFEWNRLLTESVGTPVSFSSFYKKRVGVFIHFDFYILD